MARRARGVASFLAVALVAVAIGAWLEAHTPVRSRAGPAPPVGLTGTLLFAAGGDGGMSRLWRWDLETGALTRGPTVASPVELIDAYGAHPGWVGVTSRLADGRSSASLLRFLEPDDRAVDLIEGDRIAWDGRGMTVAALEEGPLQDGCRRVTIDLVRLATDHRDRQFEREALCGRVTTIGRASLVTFFTLRRGVRTDIYFAGVQPHRLLRDHTMVSVSPTSGLLVVPTPGESDTYGAAAMLSGDVSLFFRGVGDAGPIPYGTVSRPFAIDRVLAWTADGLTAIVEGRWGRRAGLFELDGGAGAGLEVPRYLGPSSGRAFATFSQRGVAFIADGPSLWVVRDGRREPLLLPGDAPTPDGPIAWIS
jgi:hypothetical protein